MSEEIGVQMARLQEQLKAVISGLANDRDERHGREHIIDALVKSTSMLDRRLDLVERQLAENTPTIKEFMVMRHQVQGAGMLGKWVWLGAGALIGALYAGREGFRSWFGF